MTRDQREELYVKWDMYKPERQWEIITEYFDNGGAYCQKSWEQYLTNLLINKIYGKKVVLKVV